MQFFRLFFLLFIVVVDKGCANVTLYTIKLHYTVHNHQIIAVVCLSCENRTEQPFMCSI